MTPFAHASNILPLLCPPPLHHLLHYTAPPRQDVDSMRALLLLLGSVALVCAGKGGGKVRAAAKARAKSEARARFEKMYPIVFDEYARVLQWAREVKKIECEESKKSTKAEPHFK